MRQSCSPDSCTSPAITFRISVFAHFVYTCPLPLLFIISMSSLLFCAGGKCTQNGHSVAGRGVRPECRDHGPGARIPCPIDRLRRRLSPTGVCNCRLSPRTYHTGPQPPTGDLSGPRCGLGVNTPRAQGREVGHCGTRNASQVLWTGVDSPRRTWPTPCGCRAPVLFTATAAAPRWLPRVPTSSMAPGTAPAVDAMCRRTARRPRTAPLLHLCRDVHHPVVLGSDVSGYRTNPARNRKTGGATITQSFAITLKSRP